MEDHVSPLPLETEEIYVKTFLELVLAFMPESALTLHFFSGT